MSNFEFDVVINPDRKKMAKLTASLKKLPIKSMNMIGISLAAGAAELVSDIQESMQNTAVNTGRSYTSGRVAPHHPSKKGHPPAIDFGNLVGSIIADPERGMGKSNTIEVGSTLGGSGRKKKGFKAVTEAYGKGLEEEGDRPWLEPAWKRMLPQILADLEFDYGRWLGGNFP